MAVSYIYTSTLPVCNQGEGAETNICTETVYDENSNIIATIDPEGRITRTYYDELNRPYLVVQNLDPDWGYEFPEPPPRRRIRQILIWIFVPKPFMTETAM